MYDSIYKSRKALTRSISPENPTAQRAWEAAFPSRKASRKNAARDLGTGWKVSPYIRVAPGETRTIADIDGEGINPADLDDAHRDAGVRRSCAFTGTVPSSRPWNAP